MVVDIHGRASTEIAPRLWQGGFPRLFSDVRDDGFAVLVLCACELQPFSHDPDTIDDFLRAAKYYYKNERLSETGARIVCASIDDWEEPITPLEAERIALAANEVIAALRRGEKVLVTCNMGRNRSGLCSALALTQLEGISGAEAVERVRARRSGALTNPSFVALLEKIAPRRAA